MFKHFFKLLSAALALTLCFATFAACDGGSSTSESKKDGDEKNDDAYYFCAAYTDLVNCPGIGWSGTAGGLDNIAIDSGNKYHTQEGYYVTYLYVEGATITFEINSDKAVDDAKIIARLSAEGADMTISPDNYTIEVNGVVLDYKAIPFRNVPSVGGVLPFKDFTVGRNISLKEGKNVIKLITSNHNNLGGTTQATAPMVEAIKIKTSANLSWNPIMSNVEDM